VAEQLQIEKVGHRGDGIALSGGEAVYVPYTLSGEIVIAEAVPGQPAQRRLVSVEQASLERIPAFCSYFGACGGCAIQHWQPGAYLSWKRALVVDTLAQAGLSCPVDAVVDAHGEGRRRVVIHARRGADDTLRVGFATPASHALVDIAECPILEPRLKGAFAAARALAQVLEPVRKPLDIHITATDTGLDVDIRGSGPLSTPMTSALSDLASRYGLARLTRHGELVVMHRPPTLPMGQATVTLPPGSFLQATALGEETLAALVSEQSKKAKHIADLFCGIGPFALRLAAHSRVTALDSDAGAIAALKNAVANTRGLKPIDAQARDLFRRPLAAPEMRGFDAIVFDPPRQGAQAQAKQIAASRVPLVIAVSCNVATFARDARILIDGGYRMTKVTPVDQFRHSAHIELVARFER